MTSLPMLLTRGHGEWRHCVTQADRGDLPCSRPVPGICVQDGGRAPHGAPGKQDLWAGVAGGPVQLGDVLRPGYAQNHFGYLGLIWVQKYGHFVLYWVF
jgi:hypothetical protein